MIAGSNHTSLTRRAVPLALVLAALCAATAQGQGIDLTRATSAIFTGSGNCAWCHTTDGTALRDSNGTDLSMGTDWRSTLMANAAKDPIWQANVETEVAEHPLLQAIIEDKCTSCHAPMAYTQAIADGAEHFSMDDARGSALGMDGVSCSLCHQIQPTGLGTEESFSGGFQIGVDRDIFGPYQDVQTSPMQSIVDYTPMFGEQMQRSEHCATCHTLYTPYLDDAGAIAGTFPEQVPYLEWQNSDFAAQGTQCQDCHMPRVDEPVTIASVPPGVDPQQPFWRHFFVGGNTTTLKILRDNGPEIGVTCSEAQLDTTINRARAQLANQTALLSAEAIATGDRLVVDVDVENMAGHKFPTGFPSRRAWVHLVVTNDRAEVLFESGAYDASGRLDGLGMFEPHHDTIGAPGEVQIYEAVMADVNGEITHTLLRGASYKKDNRLPPKGFVSSAAKYADMAVHGAAEDDASFGRTDGTEGTGKDRVTYVVDISGQAGRLAVHASLLYQSLAPSFMDHLLSYNTPAVNRLRGYYEAADKAPDTVQTLALDVDITTGVRSEAHGQVADIVALVGNYPNPFNGGTAIGYVVGAPGAEATLTVHDVSGRLLTTLASGFVSPGRHETRWSGRDDAGREVGTGVYFCRLTSGRTASTVRMLLIR